MCYFYSVILYKETNNKESVEKVRGLLQWQAGGRGGGRMSGGQKEQANRKGDVEGVNGEDREEEKGVREVEDRGL